MAEVSIEIIQPELIDRKAAAHMCGVSVRAFDRFVASARTPRPVRFGRRVLWRRSDLMRWIDLGCPDRLVFEARCLMLARKGTSDRI